MFFFDLLRDIIEQITDQLWLSLSLLALLLYLINEFAITGLPALLLLLTVLIIDSKALFKWVKRSAPPSNIAKDRRSTRQLSKF